jgi:hypothetical protein
MHVHKFNIIKMVGIYKSKWCRCGVKLNKDGKVKNYRTHQLKFAGMGKLIFGKGWNGEGRDVLVP